MTEEQRNRFIAVLAKVGLEYAVLPEDEDEAEEAKEHNNGINELLSALASIVKSEVELACKPLAAEIKKLKSKPSQVKADGGQEEAKEEKPKAKKSVSAKKRSKPAKAEGDDAESGEEPEKKPKTKTKRVAKAKAAKEDGEGNVKVKQVKPYAAFTSFISTAMKCITDDETLDPVFGKSISVKFAKRSAGVEALFENELSEPLKSLIDTEQTIETVLKAAIDVLKAVNDGSVHMMKLTPIMWSALDQTQPVLLPVIDEAEAETDAEDA